MIGIHSGEIVRLAKDIDYYEEKIAAARKRIAELTREREINDSNLEEGKSGWKRGVYIGRYVNHHIPTGNDYPGEQEFVSRKAFLDEIAKWNRMHPDTYAYREV